MLRSNVCDCSDAYIVLKRLITVEGTINANKRIKKLVLRIIFHLDHVYHKSITHSWTMRKIWILFC